MMNPPVTAAEVDARLPQTQCTRCGFPRCRDYADALVHGGADINQCAPGGATTIAALARLFGTPVKPLNPAYGPQRPRVRAAIDEARCIGCRKCIDACPVDAIVGAAKLMHTVITDDCTGCGLCVPPCPIDCIALVPAAVTGDAWNDYRQAETERWRMLTQRRVRRLARGSKHRVRRTRRAGAVDPNETERSRIRGEIAAAVARVRRKRAEPYKPR